MRISRGLPDNQENTAIDLLFEAFGDKVASMIGQDDKAREAMRRSLIHQSCFIAEESGQLLGVLAYQIGKKVFIATKLKEFIDIFGRGGGIERYFRILSLHHTTKADELYISDISVASAAQGKGIGSKLLEATEQYANELGLKSLTLIVIEPNIRA